MANDMVPTSRVQWQSSTPAGNHHGGNYNNHNHDWGNNQENNDARVPKDQYYPVLTRTMTKNSSIFLSQRTGTAGA
jgi:hypothetical protein